MAIISFKKRLRIYMRDHFTCVYCQRPMHPLSDDLTIDHVKPDHSDSQDENLVTCCMQCNRAKGNSSPDFYLAKLMANRQVIEENKIKKKAIELSVDQIILAIAKSHHISLSELTGKSRKWRIVRARTEAIKKLREHGLTLNQIAVLLKRKDHTTIMHHLNKKEAIPYS